MAFTKFLYSIINWKNKSESLTTPIGASNLNKMDSAIKTIGDNLNAAYDEMSTGKLDMSTAYTMVKDVTYDDGSGVFTVTKLDGTTLTIDTKLEKLVTNWTYDKDSQKLILTLDDGTTQEVDLSALITQYEFIDSDTITFTIESDGSIIANIKDGSITEEKLQPNYLAEVKSNASNAETSAQNASDYADDASYDAKLAQSYAIGGSGVRDGEDADNAKYYSEQAKASMGMTRIFSKGNSASESYTVTASKTHFMHSKVQPVGVYLIIGTSWAESPSSGIYLVQYSGNSTKYLTLTTVLSGGGVTISIDDDNSAFTVTGKSFRIYALQ